MKLNKQGRLVKKKMISAIVPTVNYWPVFTPVDANATCLACGEPWSLHGLAFNHCPPCGAYVYVKDLAFRDYCNKPVNHRGKCAIVKNSVSKPERPWGKHAPNKRGES